MKHIFSLPNMITFARVLFIPVFVWVLFSDYAHKDYLAALIFIALSVSDALDGYIARKKNLITGVGKIIDPIADKLLIAAALFALLHRIDLWMIIVIIAREVIITLARMLFLKKKVISASMLGKLKTISQIVAIVAVMLQVPIVIFGMALHWWFMLIATIVTIISGIDYLMKMARLMDETIFTIPNLITSIRALLIPILIVTILDKNNDFALILFGTIIITDKLDGISARLTSQVTTFGRMFDSFVDFMAVVCAYIAMGFAGYFPLYWIYVFAFASLIMIATKSVHFYLKQEKESTVLGKVVIASSYIALFSFFFGFTYRMLLLAIAAALAYCYAVYDIAKTASELRNFHGNRR